MIAAKCKKNFSSGHIMDSSACRMTSINWCHVRSILECKWNVVCSSHRLGHLFWFARCFLIFFYMIRDIFKLNIDKKHTRLSLWLFVSIYRLGRLVISSRVVSRRFRFPTINLISWPICWRNVLSYIRCMSCLNDEKRFSCV